MLLQASDILKHTVLVTINKSHWLRLIVNQVSVVLIVSADACMQDVQGSSPTVDWMVVKDPQHILLWNLASPVRVPNTFV